MSSSPELLIPLLGLTVFGAGKGHGSFVTFGLTSTPAAPIEESYFWVYLCSWRIFASETGEEVAHSESSDEAISAAVSRLNGMTFRKLVLRQHVTQTGLCHGAALIFDGRNGRLTMTLRQNEESAPKDEIFMTRVPMRRWVSYLSDGPIAVEADV